MASELFRWRSLVASPAGPPNPTIRLILLTLSLHMDGDGGSCFPSIKRLAEETGLSERAVRGNLKLAEQQGWIHRRAHASGGRGWRLYTYSARIPHDVRHQIPHLSNYVRHQVPRRAAPGSTTCGTRFHDVRHQVPPSSSSSSTASSSPSVGTAGDLRRKTQLPAGFELSERMRNHAIQQGIDPGKVRNVFEHFCDHHRARGTTMLDWEAAWRTWVHYEKRFSAGQRGADEATPPRKLLRADNLYEMLHADNEYKRRRAGQ